MTEKNRKIAHIPALFAIIIIIVFILIFSFYVILNNQNNNNSNDTKKIEEKKVSDQNLYNKIELKVSQLALNINYTDDKEIKYSGSGLLFNSKDTVKNSDITNEFKLISSISYLSSLQDSPVQNDLKNKTFIVSQDIVENNIKNLYGDYNFSSFNIDSCPNNIKLENNNYNGSWCYKKGQDITNYYIYNITENDDDIYVYLAVSYIDFILKDDNITDMKIYKNLEKDEYIVENKSTENNKIIDETNYQEFSKYKITFEKNDVDEYIFKESVRIEK